MLRTSHLSAFSMVVRLLRSRRCALRCLVAMLEAEAVQAAFLASAGEVQALMNHLGLAARSAPTAKLVFEADLRASLRRALQFGRQEMAFMEGPLGKSGILAQPTDVIVAARSKAPQFAAEIQWHPRGEDHAGFATAAIGDVAKMVVAKSHDAVEQATVLVGAPARFWRWLPGFAEDHLGFDLLCADTETPVSAKSEFLAGGTWSGLFEGGLDRELPDRFWTSLLDKVEVRSPWAEMELRLFEVKGLGSSASVR